MSLISSDDFGSGFLWNAGTQIPDYTASLYKYHNLDSGYVNLDPDTSTQNRIMSMLAYLSRGFL